MRMKSVLAAGLLFVAGPAWAGESLIDGQPLQYNYTYHCNGERVEVARCRDEDDSSYCQVYYPDRPYHNGMMVQPVEMRGDIVARLDACARAASAKPDDTRAAAAAPASAVKAPGLGSATWHPVTYTDEMAEYYTAAGIKRTGKSGQGWFTKVYSDPKDFGNGISGVRFVQSLVRADCTSDSTRLVEIAAYDDQQKLKTEGPISDQFEKADPDSIAADELAVLCGRKEPAADVKPVAGDGEHLWEVTRIMLEMEKADSKQQ
jgi:hypothetical protein